MTKQRDLSFDIARALSALWVVGVWHLFCYDNSLNYANWTTQQITDVFLSVFMFISGYMLSKYKFEGWKDVLTFYKKRFWRFYVLYILASLSLFIGGAAIGNQMYAGISQLLLSFWGLNVFFAPHLGTLWFISMIMFFYLVTPLLSFSWRSKYMKYIVAVSMYAFFFLWREATGYVESYVFYMYPMYALGLLMPREITDRAKKNWPIVIIGFGCFLLLLSFVKNINQLWYLQLILKELGLLGGGIICTWYFRAFGPYEIRSFL